MRKTPPPPAPNPLPASVTTPTSVSARRANAAEATPSGSGTHTYIVASGVSGSRSEEHTSELQSQSNLVCRLLLEKKKKIRVEESSGMYILTVALLETTSH